jgi:hypothetical protein
VTYGMGDMATIPHPKIAFGDLADQLKTSDDEIKVPRELLNLLLDMYISGWDFDEDWYLATYPDIQAAVGQGQFASGWAHFRAIGYFEGRLGSRPIVDSAWYLDTYPDIAQAMLEGKVTSAADHFESFGYAEGRLPSAPGIDSKWYAKRYMPATDPDKVEERHALENFLTVGYRQLAFPAPPR